MRILNEVLFKRAFDEMFLWCLSKEEVVHALYETHSGICGTHQAGPNLVAELKRLGYYWPTMVQDAMDFANTCKLCEIHGD